MKCVDESPRPVTHEVAGSSPVVPASFFNKLAGGLACESRTTVAENVATPRVLPLNVKRSPDALLHMCLAVL
jgi:hypothetical protein